MMVKLQTNEYIYSYLEDRTKQNITILELELSNNLNLIVGGKVKPEIYYGKYKILNYSYSVVNRILELEVTPVYKIYEDLNIDIYVEVEDDYVYRDIPIGGGSDEV